MQRCASILLFLASFLLLSFSLRAQFPLYDRSDQPQYLSGYKRALHDGGNAFTVAGEAVWYSTITWPQTFPFVQHFDSQGNLEWTYTSAMPYHETAELTSFLRLQSGDYLLSWTLYGCDYLENRSRIEKISTTGQVIWAQDFTSSDNSLSFLFAASGELSSGNLLFLSWEGWANDDGIFKTNSAGDSIAYIPFTSMPPVADLEVLPGDRLLIAGGMTAVIADTLGNTLHSMMLNADAVACRPLSNGNLLIVTDSLMYLTDSALGLIQSAALPLAGAMPLDAFEDGSHIWVCSGERCVKLDNMLAVVSETVFPVDVYVKTKAVARGEGGFFTAGHVEPMAVPFTRWGTSTAVRTVQDDESFFSSGTDISVSSIEISNYSYDQVNSRIDMDVTAWVTNDGTWGVNDFFVSTAFGQGVGWICGGPVYETEVMGASLQPGDSMEVQFHWWDADVSPAVESNYPFTVYTSSPDYHLDANPNAAFTVWLQSGTVSRSGAATPWTLSIAPQPVQDEFQVQIGRLTEPVQLRVTDLSGRVIFETRVNSPVATFSASGWAAGMYLLSIGNEQGSLSSRLVKQ